MRAKDGKGQTMIRNLVFFIQFFPQSQATAASMACEPFADAGGGQALNTPKPE
jgi:uncharacterized membrane protein